MRSGRNFMWQSALGAERGEWMAVDLELRCASQKGKNQTLSVAGTLLWLLLASFIASEFILNQI